MGDVTLSVIAITKKKPHLGILLKAIASSGSLSPDGKEERSSIVDFINRNFSITKSADYYAQFIGIPERDAKWMIAQHTAKLRISHIITSGISHGESRGGI